MEDLEREIFKWFVAQHSEYAEALNSQLLGAEVRHRDFTKGGGVFIGLTPAARTAPLTSLIASGLTGVDGPEIRSFELKAGALASLFFDQSGFVDHLEIFAYCGDYPAERHPRDASLHVAKRHDIDL